jgi:hypothetical protein
VLLPVLLLLLVPVLLLLLVLLRLGQLVVLDLLQWEQQSRQFVVLQQRNF